MNYAIIAAGEGSRLAQEGVRVPKPLVRLNGVPLIDRLIDLFLKNDAASITIIVNNEMKEVQEHLKKMKLPVPLHLVIKSTPGSMHSFYEISRYLQNGKFCLTTVDTIFKENEFAGYIKNFIQNDSIDGSMAVTSFIDDEKPLFVATGPQLDITGFLDRHDGNCRYISGGVYCLTPRALPVLNEAMRRGITRMRDFQRQLVAGGLHLKAYPFRKIVDVDHACDILTAERFLQEEDTE